MGKELPQARPRACSHLPGLGDTAGSATRHSRTVPLRGSGNVPQPSPGELRPHPAPSQPRQPKSQPWLIQAPPFPEGKDHIQPIPLFPEGKDQIQPTPPFPEGKDQIQPTPPFPEGKDQIHLSPIFPEGKDQIQPIPLFPEGKDQIQLSPSFPEGKDHIQPTPPLPEGKDHIQPTPLMDGLQTEKRGVLLPVCPHTPGSCFLVHGQNVGESPAKTASKGTAWTDRQDQGLPDAHRHRINPTSPSSPSTWNSCRPLSVPKSGHKPAPRPKDPQHLHQAQPGRSQKQAGTSVPQGKGDPGPAVTASQVWAH
uniref:Uncharacterized protein n=1 Tax=Cyanoderma ruficeps TaxID=181631 RepID=A0A8C3RHX7_9PASS